MSDSNSLYIAFITLALFFTITSTIALICLLLLNFKMKEWNGLIQILVLMTSSQLLFNFGYFFQIVTYANKTDTIFSYLGLMIGGISAALYSSILAYTVVYLIVFRQVLDIKRYFIRITSFCVLPSVITFFIFCAAENASNDDVDNSILLLKVSIYLDYFIRLLSLIFNLACYFTTSIEIRKMINDNTINQVFMHMCITYVYVYYICIYDYIL